MKTRRKLLTLAAAMFAFAAIMTPQSAMALTAPCTEISNTAILGYEVGGVPQINVSSDDPTVTPGNSTDTNPTKFNVGVKINVTVAKADAAYVTVTPSTDPANKKWLTYTVTNNGNARHTYTFTGHNAATNTTSPFAGGLFDIFDATTTAILVENGANFTYTDDADRLAKTALTAYVAGTDVATTLTLAPGETNVVYVVYTPSDLQAKKDEISVFYLKALTNWSDVGVTALGANLLDDGNDNFTVTTAMTGSVACGAGGIPVDVVLGDLLAAVDPDADTAGIDEARDGAHAAKDAFKVANAVLVHTKSFAVISDGVNTGIPYQLIPGAVVEYSLGIENTGNASAVLGNITDTLVNEFKIVTAGASWSITGDTRTLDSGALTASLVAADSDGLSHGDPTAVGGIVTAAMATILVAQDLAGTANDYLAGELKAGEKVTLKFRATIQ